MGKGKGSRSNKKGVGFNWLLGAVIMVFVVLTIKPVKDIAYAATENTAKVFGLDIGKPRIGSFSVTPVDTNGDNKWEMSFDLSVAGNKDGAYLEIYESKASKDATATQLEPPPAKFGDDDRIYSSRRTEGKLAELAKKGVFNINCPAHDECKALGYVPEPREEFRPDLYKFSAVIRKEKDNKVVYSKDAVAGLYDEQYVELFGRKISGCSNCNVIECKKAAMNDHLEGSQANVAPAIIGIVNELSSQSCSAFAFPTLDFSSCADKQVDDFNKEFARVRLLKAANDFGVTSEKEYSELSLEEAESAKAFAISDTMFCSGKLYGYLAGQGWVSIDPIAGLRALTIKNNLDNVLLTKAYPKISSFQATPIFQDSTSDLSWELVKAGSGNVKKFAFRHEITKYARPYDAATNPGYSKPIQDVPNFQRSIKGEELQEFGRHKFELKVFAKDDAETDVESVVRGKFNDSYPDSYLELYEGKVELPGYEGTFNIVGAEKAYLDGDFLHDDGIVSDNKEAEKVAARLNIKLKNRYPGSECELNNNGRLEEEAKCAHEDIRELYNLAILEAINYKGKEYALNVLNCNIPEGSLNPPRRHPDYVYTGIMCELKAGLRKAFLENGWLEVIQPGKDAAIQAAVDKFADEDANPAVTDLKAVASISQPGKLELTWSMPLGKMNVLNDAILLQHWRTQYLENLDWTKENQPPVTSVPVEPAKYYFEPMDLTGQHKFRFTTWSKDGSSSDVKTLITGVYDRSYLDKYDSDVDDDVCEEAEKATVAVGKIGCNVIKEKTRVFLDDVPKSKQVFGEEKLFPRLAYHRFHDENLDKDCGYDWEKKKLFSKSDGKSPCSAEDVNTLYTYLIDEIYPLPQYSASNSGAKSCYTGGLGYNVWRACSAKKNLLEVLQKKSWSCSGDGCPRPGLPIQFFILPD